MVLKTYKQRCLLFLCCLIAALQAPAQDSNWYYANNLTDYATADLVCLVRVGETKILDTIGSYTIQEVAFEPIQYYKGQTRQRTFRAWLESHQPVWQAGTLRGYYLLRGKPDSAEPVQAGKESYYWLENAGFALKDTPFIVSLGDKATFKKIMAQYFFSETAGGWAKVTFLDPLPVAIKDNPFGMKATLRMERDVPALKLKKGQVVTVSVRNNPYAAEEAFQEQVKKNRSRELALFLEEGELTLKTEFILPQ